MNRSQVFVPMMKAMKLQQAWPVLLFIGMAASCSALASDEKKEEGSTPDAQSPPSKAEASSEPAKGDAKGDAKGEPAKEAVPGEDLSKTGSVKVWKRRFVFPALEPQALPKIESGQASTADTAAASRSPDAIAPWNPKASRFTVVALLASWNPKSAALIPWLNGMAQGELARRKVRVLAAFSHDTETSVSRFVKETRPRFDVGLAPLPFLKEMGNPKVPTVWVLNNRGEIVTRKEMPSDAILDELRMKILDWTDF